MKRKMISLVVSICLVLGIAGIAVAANPIKIVVNGQRISSDVAPFTQKGRTMVPIRFIAEALGADVRWDDGTQTVHINAPVGSSTDSRVIENIEVLVEIVRFIENMEDLNDWIYNTGSDGMSLIVDARLEGHSGGPTVSVIRERLTEIKNSLARWEQSWVELSTSFGIDEETNKNFSVIFEDLNYRINSEFATLELLEKWIISNKTADFNNYMDAREKANDDHWAVKDQTFKFLGGWEDALDIYIDKAKDGTAPLKISTKSPRPYILSKNPIGAE